MVPDLVRTENSLVSLNHKGLDMKNGKWETIVLSDVGYECLVAEVSFNGQFLLLLDREQGRDAVCIAFPKKDGQLSSRIPLGEFIEQLQAAADDLCR